MVHICAYRTHTHTIGYGGGGCACIVSHVCSHSRQTHTCLTVAYMCRDALCDNSLSFTHPPRPGRLKLSPVRTQDGMPWHMQSVYKCARTCDCAFQCNDDDKTHNSIDGWHSTTTVSELLLNPDGVTMCTIHLRVYLCRLQHSYCRVIVIHKWDKCARAQHPYN